jgi:Ras-related protein Rab-2A
MATGFNYVFKFILIGDSGVGKSCLLLQFVDKRFKNDHDLTIGVEFGSKVVSLGSENVKLQVWDTVTFTQAGQESFRSITRSYYRSAVAALLVFDLTKRDSFESLGEWLAETKANANPTLSVVLVGNKADLEAEYRLYRRLVTSVEAKGFAEAHGLEYIETSAKSGLNAERCFTDLSARVLRNIQAAVYDLSNESCGIKTVQTVVKGPMQVQQLKKEVKKQGCAC